MKRLGCCQNQDSLQIIEETGENFQTGFISILSVIQENMACIAYEYTTAQNPETNSKNAHTHTHTFNKLLIKKKCFLHNLEKIQPSWEEQKKKGHVFLDFCRKLDFTSPQARSV